MRRSKLWFAVIFLLATAVETATLELPAKILMLDEMYYGVSRNLDYSNARILTWE